MTDLSTTIIAKSDQLNSEDLLSGPRDIIVTDVRGATGDQPISIFFEGDNNKPFKPCKSVRRLLVYAWGSDGSQYKGRAMRIYNDPSVKWAGKPVGGIRISHLSHIDEPFTLALTVTRGSKKPYKIEKLEAPQSSAPVELTQEQKTLIFDGETEALSGMQAYQDWFTARSQEEKMFLVNNGHHADLKAKAGS